MDAQGSAELLGGEKFVRLTTFRRDGTPVATPVWLVRDADALLVITGANTGKVKRLRHTARVLIAPSDFRGNLKPRAREVEATATVSRAPADLANLNRLMRGKYGIQFAMSGLVNRLRARRAHQPVEVRVTFPPSPPTSPYA